MRPVSGTLPRSLGLLVAAVLLAGCGVRPQDQPEQVTTAAPPSVEVGADSRPVGPRLTVFFVRGADLAPVQRTTDAGTTAAALDLLVEGPTRTEVGTGIRTALAPELVGVEQPLPDPVATVAVTRGFTGLTGGNQLLAVAQVVWTLTDLPTVTAVRFTVDGAPVEVPTDDGLTDLPVDRDDYRSVAPAESVPSGTPGEDDATPTGSSTPR
ncbi:GerMN domain-containing protein [Geodermatophilus sp. SYSU D00697]